MEDFKPDNKTVKEVTVRHNNLPQEARKHLDTHGGIKYIGAVPQAVAPEHNDTPQEQIEFTEDMVAGGKWFPSEAERREYAEAQLIKHTGSKGRSSHRQVNSEKNTQQDLPLG